ncbi:MAG: hypothetical protein KatS3mg129_3036 [Leptospiraceae bacterium]|nr:MAG: hypothetical protein KatS3mg129_3036 [Leptospiraceae bacterium]
MLVVRKFLLLHFFVIPLSCIKQNIILCDNYDYSLKKCINYNNPIIINTAFDQTIKHLSYDLYFHQKITLGILQKYYNQSYQYQCYYKIYSDNTYEFEEELEGSRIINHSFWCFDYLGSMILNYYKKHHKENKRLLDINKKKIQLDIELLLIENNKWKKNLKRRIIIQNLY